VLQPAPVPRGGAAHPRCDPHRPWRAGAAILATATPLPHCGGCDPHRPWRAGAARPPRTPRCAHPRCDPHRPWRAGAAIVGGDRGDEAIVAILTDPEGPVLPAPTGRSISPRSCRCDPHRPWRAGAARSGTRHGHGWCRGCDPHRPWRAGAAMRQWTDEIARQLRVAILTDPGGPVLRPPRCWPTCPRVIGCDPHRPWRAGAAIAAQCDKLGPCKSALRSSPTLEGRCCTGRSSTWTPPGRRCDPHRPWRAGAAWCEHVGNPERRKLRSSPTLEGRCCRLG